jgi:hypothetical protein
MANTRQARRKTGSEKDRLGERQARRKTGSEIWIINYLGFQIVY